MTRQELFNTVYLGLAAQEFATSLKAGTASYCMYRGDKGRKCAAGQAIPDSAYTPEMEGKIISHIVNTYPILEELRPHLHLLSDLQRAHDFFRYLDNEYPSMQQALAAVAEAHHLEVPQ